MKLSPANTGKDTRYCIKGDPGPASYTVEGLETLVMHGKLTLGTELAQEGTTEYRPVSEWPFSAQLFPLKRIFGFKPEAPPRPFALDHVEITSREELQEIIRRDPHDVRVTMLINLIKASSVEEGLTVDELLEEFFARKRAELAAKPPRRLPQSAPTEAPPPRMKNVTPS